MVIVDPSSTGQPQSTSRDLLHVLYPSDVNFGLVGDRGLLPPTNAADYLSKGGSLQTAYSSTPFLSIENYIVYTNYLESSETTQSI